MTTIEEMYVRAGLMDLGTTIADLGLTQITESTVVIVPNDPVTLSHTPNSAFSPEVRKASTNVLQRVGYGVVGNVLTFSPATLTAGTYTITYWY